MRDKGQQRRWLSQPGRILTKRRVPVRAYAGCALIIFTQAYKDHYSDPESHLRVEAAEILMYADECRGKDLSFKIFVMDPGNPSQGTAAL